jgi:hypothetical protein
LELPADFLLLAGPVGRRVIEPSHKNSNLALIDAIPGLCPRDGISMLL